MLRPRVALLLVLAAVAACRTRPEAPALTPTPATLDEFRAAAESIVRETGVPGAAVALVRPHGIEWAGGIGVADRERGTRVTAETHFRVGSISKTFVAIALVQQYLDNRLDIEASVSELAPNIAIDNPFGGSPVTVLQLLQHTAGFDDMHFNEMYNLEDPPDLPLERVLSRNPASRRVRWRPGTRMSYSNPGYGVAAYVLEQVTGQPYEQVIRDRIFTPLAMRTSSFILSDEDLPLLARGYDHPSRPAVPFSQIYLRPAGNLHTSARELGVFVQMLLNWGETAEHLVIDPEYLSNMERPRTSLSARSGLIYGYGSGIASQSIAGFPVLGHGGGIDGFLSFYGYSAARDAGWVVLVNATYAPAALERLSELAVRYLKRDVEPPPRPEHHPAAEVLGRYAGYYQNVTPRNAILGAFENVLGGESVTADGNALLVRPFLGRPEPLIPVSDTLFRRRDEVTPSRVFATDEDGQTVMLGDGYYGVRRSRWRVELLRGALALAAVILATAPLAMIVWLVRARRIPAPGFWPLKITITLLPAALAACFAIAVAPAREWGVMNTWTRLTFVGSWAVPLLAMVTLVLTASALQRDARPWFAFYTTMIAVSALSLAAYMAVWGLVGLRPWAY